jgi:hypothetical protein
MKARSALRNQTAPAPEARESGSRLKTEDPIGARIVRGLFLAMGLTALFLFAPPLQAATIEYTYDLNDRLTGAVYGGGKRIHYTLDGVGNILALTSADPAAQTDPDGVADGLEWGPTGNDPNYDGDGNGVPDYLESRVASLPTVGGGKYVTLSVPPGLTLNSVRALGNPSPTDTPSNVEFPYGFFEFSVIGLTDGGCTSVTLYLPEDRSLNTYYKYSGTPDQSAPHWYSFLDNGQTGAAITHEAGKTVVTLSLCDDQRGDGDLSLNGTISDPGGPARFSHYDIYLPLIFKP